jgi:hypothetical protein
MATIAIADEQSTQPLSAYGIARSTVEGAHPSARRSWLRLTPIGVRANIWSSA